MTRNFFLTALAVGLLVAATPRGSADAQVISIGVGRGGVRYNGYGRGYYGGYGHGYVAGPRIYSGYGNGPYGYGYGNGSYYNGYGNSGFYVQPNRGFYRPFGGRVYTNYGYGW